MSKKHIRAQFEKEKFCQKGHGENFAEKFDKFCDRPGRWLCLLQECLLSKVSQIFQLTSPISYLKPTNGRHSQTVLEEFMVYF